MHRLAIVISHPIQYHAPLYGYLAKDGRFQIKVFFMSDRGARPFYEKFSGTMVRYDNPILEGYDHVFLHSREPKNWWQRKTEFVHLGLGKELLNFNPHAVYFHGYTNPSFWLAMLICKRKGIKVLLRGENEDVLPRPWWRMWLREIFLKILLPNLDGVLYIGQHNKEFFLKRKISENRLFYVPYSVDNHYFRGGRSQAELDRIRKEILNKYGFEAGCLVFIYTHKLRPTMRPIEAVSAFCEAIRSQNLRSALIMCGDGELRSEAEKAAEKNGGKGRVIFTGYLSQRDLRDHMLSSDIMINSAIEPWGCSVNEGLACGLAMIVSDQVVGWPDMVMPGLNGYVYQSGEVHALAQNIQKFSLMTVGDLTRMKQESLKLSERLSFATCADGLAAAMRNVCPE